MIGFIQERKQLAATIAALLASVGAVAQTISYPDSPAEFVAATGAKSIGALGPYGALFPTTVGLITFQNGPDAHGGFGDSSNELPGVDISFGNWENFTLLIAGGAYAIGYSEHEPAYLGTSSPVTGCNSQCTDSTFSIELFAGTKSLAKYMYNAPDDPSELPGGPVGFFGVWSATAFDRVEVREVDGSIDNEYFGNFLLTPVPEPSTAILWMIGGLALRSAHRRFRGALPSKHRHDV